MNAIHSHSWNSAHDLWVLSLELFPEASLNSFVSSNSSGVLLLYSLDIRDIPLSQTKAHVSSINATNKINEYSLASASTDGVKLWDLRLKLDKPFLTLFSGKSPNYLSVGSEKGHTIAAGTELVGPDAEIHIWDLRNTARMARSFVDSHHDDVTSLKFHPSLLYLMSGSTDGCVNVYDLSEPDENEALHQVVNFDSVHLCHFTTPRRILILSHTESLGFWDLNSTEYEVNNEAASNELGDVRPLWPDCEYVVDLYPGYVGYGSNLNLTLSLMPFDASNEVFNITERLSFPGAHGEEIVRDIRVVLRTNTALTCGEDGLIKSWSIPNQLYEQAIELAAQEDYTGPQLEKNDDTKEKMYKVKKKQKKRKDKKSKKESRFKPY